MFSNWKLRQRLRLRLTSWMKKFHWNPIQVEVGIHPKRKDEVVGPKETLTNEKLSSKRIQKSASCWERRRNHYVYVIILLSLSLSLSSSLSLSLSQLAIFLSFFSFTHYLTCDKDSISRSLSLESKLGWSLREVVEFDISQQIQPPERKTRKFFPYLIFFFFFLIAMFFK